VTESDVLKFLASLKNAGAAETSLRRLRTTIKQIHSFLVAERHCASNPTARFERLPRIKTSPYIMDMGDVDCLLETAHQLAANADFGPRRQAGYARRAALLETLYASGMRIGEAISLPASFIRSDARSLVINGRGGKQRMVLLHARATEAIMKWKYMAETIGLPSSEWVFHSIKNVDSHLSRQTAFDEIKEIAVAAGIPEAHRVSPKSLRHAFGAHLLRNGADLKSVQAMLGHVELGTMEVYARMIAEDEKAATLAHHPLEVEVQAFSRIVENVRHASPKEAF
jgi:integrase/recombinase XerD